MEPPFGLPRAAFYQVREGPRSRRPPRRGCWPFSRPSVNFPAGIWPPRPGIGRVLAVRGLVPAPAQGVFGFRKDPTPKSMRCFCALVSGRFFIERSRRGTPERVQRVRFGGKRLLVGESLACFLNLNKLEGEMSKVKELEKAKREKARERSCLYRTVGRAIMGAGYSLPVRRVCAMMHIVRLVLAGKISKKEARARWNLVEKGETTAAYR